MVHTAAAHRRTSNKERGGPAGKLGFMAGTSDVTNTGKNDASMEHALGEEAESGACGHVHGSTVSAKRDEVNRASMRAECTVTLPFYPYDIHSAQNHGCV